MVGLLLMASIVCAADESKTLPPAADRPVDFVKEIQPILKSRCYSCHDGAKQRGGFRLDVKAAAFKGGESFAPAICPANPQKVRWFDLSPD